MRMLRPIVLLSVIVVLASGCNDDEFNGASSETSPPESSVASGIGRTTNRGQTVQAEAVGVIEAVYRAAIARDTAALTKLCYPCSDADYARSQLQLWQRAGVLEQLVKVLGTHPATTDGYTYPGFRLGGLQSDLDVQDAKALGVSVPAGARPQSSVDYDGVSTTFESPDASASRRWVWLGLSVGP